MKGYGNIYGDYKTYETPSPDGWRRTGNESPDHVCRPVIIDAQGRKRAIVTMHPPTYITKTETLVLQNGLAPLGSEYNHGNHLARDAWEEYGVQDQYRKPLSSVIDRPQTVEFFNKIHTEASDPRFDHSSNASDWRRTPKTTGYGSNNGIYDESYSREFPKHGGKMSQNDGYDDYHRNQGSTEPAMITTGGRPWPSHARWSSPPRGSLTQPTNNINEAIAMLKEVAKISGTGNPHTPYTAETIDNKEAEKRYGKFNFNHSSRPYASEDRYTTTIDSREATRKYGGKNV